LTANPADHDAPHADGTPAEPHYPPVSDDPATAPAMSDAEIAALSLRVEALLFVSAKPLAARRIAELLGLTSVIPIRRAAEKLAASCESRSFELREHAGGYQFMTRPAHENDVLLLQRQRRAQKLSPGGLETLAVIAYKQPITRTELEAIRGSGSDHHIRALSERGLIRIVDRKREEGTIGGMGAALYGTTTQFLDEFGLGTLSELPTHDDLSRPQPALVVAGDAAHGE
jgi:segregation and condensation protein B